MNFLLKAQENPKAKIKQVAPIEVKISKDSDDEESISDDESSVKN